MTRSHEVPIEKLSVGAYTVPTDLPESDGTLEWNATTVVVVTASAAGQEGIGYTYADTATATLINEKLAAVVAHRDALAPPAAYSAMASAVRNLGRPGIAGTAVAAVDAALWDLKARLLDLPLVVLLGRLRPEVPVYGSGGFTSYPMLKLQEQLAGWARAGMARVKMKVGRRPEEDVGRVRAAREAIGDGVALFVDANGAYSRKQALAFADAFARYGVTWFEEPVTATDLAGLRLLRDRAPAGMAISVGEYGYEHSYFHRLLAAGAVDVLQADATRCGITGFLAAAAECAAHELPFSSHCAPALHLHPCCAAGPVVHMEYFHDHVRIERMLFDGVIEPRNGTLAPDLSRSGIGLELKRSEATRYAA